MRMQTPRFVGVYAVTRQWGGPEEGGWWFDALEHVVSVPLTVAQKRALVGYNGRGWRADGSGTRAFASAIRMAHGLRKRLRAVYADMAYGDIYSVLGGVAVEVAVEVTPGDQATRERPRYE